MENGNGEFYRDKFFDAMNERFDRVDIRLNDHSEKLNKIEGQMRYMYGYVAGAAAIFMFTYDYIKKKILNS